MASLPYAYNLSVANVMMGIVMYCYAALVVAAIIIGAVGAVMRAVSRLRKRADLSRPGAALWRSLKG